MTFIKSTVSRFERPNLLGSHSRHDRFSARFAMPAGTASELRQAMSQSAFTRLLDGLERRKLICRRDPCN
jgi:hypothetical protein